ncbi:MAG: hypothetical protein ABI210_00315, partial [Abditibacteriaceae bacterium]
IPKDVIVANWQYTDKVVYPSQDLFQKDGLKTIAAPWYGPLNVRNFTQAAINDNSWGTLQTSWPGFFPDANSLVTHGREFSAFILAADYSWSGRTELPDALPYNAATRWTHAYMPQINTQRSGDLLDLEPAAHVAAKNWLGLGEGWDLNDFFASQNQAATRRFDGVDFRMPKGHFVVLSSIPRVMAPADALQELTLDVNQKAIAIAFLHSTLWNVPDETTAALCTVEYADGTDSEVKFTTGSNIAPWQGDSVTANAVSAWKGTSSANTPFSLYALRWENPSPEKVITRLILQPIDAQAGYVLAGVTLIQ